MTDPIGWYVVQPQTAGIFESQSNKGSASMSGLQTQFGPMGLVGKKSVFGISGQIHPAGEISSYSKKGDMSLAESPIAGAINSASNRSDITLVHEFTGALAVQLKKAVAVLAAEQVQVGSAASSSKKAAASLIGPPEVLVADTTSGALSSTRTLSSRTITAALPLKEGDILIQWANIVSGAVTVLTEPSGWNNLFSSGFVLGGAEGAPSRIAAVWHLVTAAEAGVLTSFTLTNIMDANATGRQWTIVIRGADPVAPFDHVAHRNVYPAEGGMTFPNLAPTKSGDLLLYFGGPDDVAKSLGTAPTGIVEIVRTSGGAGSTSGVVARWPDVSHAGVAVTGPIYTYSNDESNLVSLAIAVKPQ